VNLAHFKTLTLGLTSWTIAVVIGIYNRPLLTPLEEALFALGTGFLVLFLLQRYLNGMGLQHKQG